MNYTKLKIFTVFAAAALMVTMFGHTQQSKDTSQSQGSSMVCINDECDVNFSSSPSSIRDSIEEDIEEEKEDMNESIEESLADNE
jgi:gas vesicle protein